MDLERFWVAERVDRTNAERQKRFRARKRRDAATVTPGVTLSAAAMLAEREALDVLGSDGVRFAAAVRRYVMAVDVAEHARTVWEAADRPVRDVFANGMSGVSPYLKAWEQAEAQAARFADCLGLTPSSQKRISGVRGAGRPMGAASAADRKARPGPLLRGEPARLTLARDEAVNRARGHVVD
jgi:hypothetical protein